MPSTTTASSLLVNLRFFTPRPPSTPEVPTAANNDNATNVDDDGSSLSFLANPILWTIVALLILVGTTALVVRCYRPAPIVAAIARRARPRAPRTPVSTPLGLAGWNAQCQELADKEHDADGASRTSVVLAEPRTSTTSTTSDGPTSEDPTTAGLTVVIYSHHRPNDEQDPSDTATAIAADASTTGDCPQSATATL